MDDRFREEAVTGNKDTAHSIPKSGNLGDFSENIQSTRGRQASISGGMSKQKPARFQVHLPEEAASIPDFASTPVRTPEPFVREVTGKEYVESLKRETTAFSPPKTNASSEKKMSGGSASGSAKSYSGSKTAPGTVKKNVTAKKTSPSTGRRPSDAGRNKKKSSRKKKYDFINSVLVACVCIIFISILTVTASTVAMTTINDILVIDKDGGGGYISVYIPPEATEYEQVFEIVKDAGLIKQPFITDIFCKFRHYDEIERKNSETGVYETIRIKYSPGTYFFSGDMGIEEILEEIMVSSSGYKDTVRLTFPEGWTVAQIFQKIEKYGVCDADKLYANLDITGEQYEFINKIGTVNGRYLKAEGYLFPDTYDFFIGENAGSVIKKLLNNFDGKWKSEYNDRLKELKMSVDQVMTIASVIQREAKDTTQMDVISSVIHNRLKDKATYPSIDMNSTKDYVLSLKEFNLFSDFYYNLYLNSYNTYSNPGLPPGPICNPGAAAIRAALYPAKTNYHFFCHNDNGDIFLAETASEHQANTEKVLYGR